MQSTADYDANNLEVHYYYDALVKESKAQLYSDDGVTANAFEKGKYELLKFKSEIGKRWLEIELEVKTGANYQSTTKQIELVLHNINKRPKRIKLNGKKIEENWDSSKNTLTISLQWNLSNTLKLKIKL